MRTFHSQVDVASAALIQNKLDVSSAESLPLRDAVHPEHFSHVAVPFSWTMVVPALLCVCLLVLHERRVEAGAKPLLASHSRNSTVPLQTAFLAFWMVPFLIDSMFMSLSLDYALAMGESATASGVFLGAAAAGSTVGIVIGRGFTSETDWNQKYARKIFVYMYGLSLMAMPVMAISIQTSVDWSPGAKRQMFWSVVVLNFCTTCVGSIPVVAWSTMWNIVTPQKEKTFWMMLTQSARNAGFILGPLCLAGISHVLRKVRDVRAVSPISMMSWAFMGSFFIQLVELAAYSLIIPTHLQPADGAEELDASREEASDVHPEQLPAPAREQMMWDVVFYLYERTFSTGAIEVATIMLLEVPYGWSPELSGISFVVIAAGSLLLTGVSAIVLSKMFMTESNIFLLMTCLGFAGSIFLFDVKFFGAGALLAADAFVYGGTSVATGIAEGWACRAATPGTAYNIEAFRAHSVAGVNVSRFLAPIVARFLLEFGGRNLYAAVQSFLCLVAAVTVHRIVSSAAASQQAVKGQKSHDEGADSGEASVTMQ
ncbi:AVT1 [Symbiodinium sp. KB8]|nr:AVT1 [Symbiodinium sp. KB8]